MMHLAHATFERLARQINGLCGLALSSDKTYLIHHRLGPVAERFGLDSYEALCDRLAAPGPSPLHDEVIEAIASATSDGVPSARLVVLRGLRRGLVFFTDCESDKGAELAANPQAAAVLHWLVPAHRQVRVAGPAERVSEDEADEYWSTRARAVRVVAVASRQSRAVASRTVLETQVRDIAGRYPDGAGIPRPPRWGGFRVLPSRVEFWQESPDGLHDRIRYRADGSGWIIERLSP